MADCCEEIRKELGALRAEVARLGKIDEERIVTKAVHRSQEIFDPKLLYAMTLIGAAKKIADIATIKAGQAFAQSRTAQGMAVQAEQYAKKNIKLLDTKLSTRILSAEAAAAVAKLRAKEAQALANLVKGQLAAALVFIGSLAAKVADLLIKVTKLAGAIAGLMALYGLLNSVFPRLDSHDREITQLNNDLTTTNGLAVKGIQDAAKAQATASEARKTAELGLLKSNEAKAEAKLATEEAIKAKAVADAATATSNTALARADNAEAQAADAILKSKQAQSDAADAIGKAKDAASKADKATADAKDAIKKSDEAVVVAQAARVVAVQATDKAKEAIKTADTAYIQARAAQVKAEEAIAKIPPIETQIAEVKPISEKALTEAYKSLNEVKQVDSNWRAAFQPVSLTVTELKPVPLQVTELKAEQLNLKNELKQKNQQQQTQQETQKNNQANQQNQQQITNLQNQLQQERAMNQQAITAIAGIGTMLLNMPNTLANNDTYKETLRDAAATGACRTTKPGGCMDNLVRNAANNAGSQAGNNLWDKINTALNVGVVGSLRTIDNKLGIQIPNGGIAGAMGRLSNFLGIDRIFNLINFAATIHNAAMLSSSLKVTLLETLSSVGNATGLLQTPEGDNVDLNAVYSKGVEQFVVMIVGAEAWASFKLNWVKYNAIYRAANNSIMAFADMTNSLGNAIETTAEYTGKIGNALRSFGVVGENAYQWFSEKVNARGGKYHRFSTRMSGVTEGLEVIQEIAESVVESQEAATEFQKANTEFIKELKKAEKAPLVENEVIKKEMEEIKKRATKDPTGELEEGLLSFITE